MGLFDMNASKRLSLTRDDKLDCKDKRVAVIGNGSSGIQAFGALQKESSRIAHYIRSPTWISLNYLSQFTRDGSNFECEISRTKALPFPLSSKRDTDKTT